ncbi:MAG: hypothetical protein HFI38_06670 [Lachnospiraceae bacterium]|jgi:hypothetical protein|nr:hypothetical protein [Lachnospiraceae bacterium]
MKRKRFAGLCILLAFVFLAVGKTAQAQELPQEPVTQVKGLDVEIIWDSSLVRAGRDMPVTVRVQSSGPEIDGVAIAYIPADHGKYFAMEKPLSVSGGETGQVLFCIPVDYSTGTIRIEFRDQGGALYALEVLPLRVGYNPQDIYIGAVSDSLRGLDVFDRVMLNEYRGTVTRLFDFKADTLPEEREALVQYDILLLDGVKESQISQRQREALDSWVHSGGVLIIGNDSDLWEETGEGEIRQKNWGRGEYVYCGFSLEEAGNRYPDDAHLREFLNEAVGTSRLNAINEDGINFSGDYWSVSNVTSNVDSDRIPPVWLYSLVLAIYLILMGPALYHVLRKKERRQMLRVAMVGIAVLFTGIIYIIGSTTRFIRPFVNYVSIREVRDGMVMETVYTSARSPYGREYSFEVKQDYILSPLPRYDYMGDGLIPGEDNCRMYIRYGEGGTSVRINEDIPFTSAMLRLTRNEKNLFGEGFIGDITLFEGQMEGSIANRCGQDFERVCLLAGGHMVYIGDLSDGETVDLSEKETLPLLGCRSYTVMGEISGRNQYQSANESREAALASWRNQVLSYYMDTMMAVNSAEATLLAFPQAEDVELLKDSDVDVRGITLVTAALFVNYEKDGFVYLPRTEEAPEVLQGSYNEENNSTYEQMNVIQYDFGDLQVERLQVNWPSEQEEDAYTRAFHGTIEFYNWKSRTYVCMEQKEEYSGAELADYLDENNHLTVRYEDAAAGDYEYEVFLPGFAAVGRKG